MADEDLEFDFSPWIAGVLPAERRAGGPLALTEYAPAIDDSRTILVENFLNTTPFDMARLFDAIQGGDTERVSGVASRLAVACSAVGADDLADLLLDLVSLAELGDRSALSANQRVLGVVCSQAYDRLEKSL